MKRTTTLIRNIIWGAFAKSINIMGPFIITSIMIKKLGVEYLGLNSLFTSILMGLNVAELGLGSAIVFFLYKPVAENNKFEICRLLNFYKLAYRIIGIIIFLLGLGVMPFLKILIGGSYPDEINIRLIYMIYLLNTTISYCFFAYKQVLLRSALRNDIESKVLAVTKMLMYFLQLLILILWQNYYIYLIVLPLFTLISNFCIFTYATRLFPDYSCKGMVEKSFLAVIFKKTYALAVAKICIICRNSLDAIIISSFLGLTILAQYQNYYYLLTSVGAVFAILIDALLSSTGNAIATEDNKTNYKIFNNIAILFNWLTGWLTISLLCLYQDFMVLWVGKNYLFSDSIMYLFCIYFYLMRVGDIGALYIESTGLWWERKTYIIVETITNLVLNLLLVKNFGLAGVMLATLLSMLLINIPGTVIVLFKNYFHESPIGFLKKQGKYIFINLIVGFVCYSVCKFITLGELGNFIVKGIICFFIINISFFTVFRKEYEFEYLFLKFKVILGKNKS